MSVQKRGEIMTGLGNKEIFAKNLQYYIDRSGKDRRQLAEIWGVPYSTLTNWITAKKYPRIDKVEIMADYFCILKSDLIEERQEQEKPANDDGLTDDQRALIDFARSLSEEQAALALRILKSIVESD